MSTTMTVGQLRQALEGVDDRLEVVVRFDTDKELHVGGAITVALEHGCCETPSLMIDANAEVESAHPDPCVDYLAEA